MRVSFSPEISAAMQLAYAVVVKKSGKLPILLGIRGQVPTFHFAGGTVVKVPLKKTWGSYVAPWHAPISPDWVLSKIEIVFYQGREKKKTKEVWDSDKLEKIYQYLDDILIVKDSEIADGWVAICDSDDFDDESHDSFIEIDPPYIRGGYQVVHEIPYKEGGEEKAKEEAEAWLQKYASGEFAK